MKVCKWYYSRNGYYACMVGLYKLYLHHLEQGRWKGVDLIKVNAALVYLQ